MKILVVDDDRYILELTDFMLKDENYDISTCTSVDDAVAALNDNKFDLVISDIVMPQKDGTRLIEHVKKHSPDVPVLAITGGLENAAEDYKHLADLFADETLTKPVKKDDLIATIKRLTA